MGSRKNAAEFGRSLGPLVAICGRGDANGGHRLLGGTIRQFVQSFVPFPSAGLMLARFVTRTPAPKPTPAASAAA